MLRAAQFAARFEYASTPGAARRDERGRGRWCAPSRPSGFTTSSPSSSRAREPSIGLELLRETGVLAHLWPELLEGVGVEQNEWHAYDVYRHQPGHAGRRAARRSRAAPGRLAPRRRQAAHERRPALLPPRDRGRRDGPGDARALPLLERGRQSDRAPGPPAHVLGRPGAERRRAAALHPADRAAQISNVCSHCGTPTSRVAGCPSATGRIERSRRASAPSSRASRRSRLRELAIGGDDVIAALVRRGDAPPGFHAATSASATRCAGSSSRSPMNPNVTSAPCCCNSSSSISATSMSSHHRARQSKRRRRQEHDGRESRRRARDARPARAGRRCRSARKHDDRIRHR